MDSASLWLERPAPGRPVKGTDGSWRIVVGPLGHEANILFTKRQELLNWLSETADAVATHSEV
jgi:hypothetical protein